MKLKYSLFTLLIIFCMGCNDFLEETNPSNFMQDSYFTKPEHALSIINAIYADLRYSAENDAGGQPYFMTDFQTGFAGTRTQNINLHKIASATNDADNQYSRSWWRYPYRAIANANTALVRIPEITMDESKKRQYIGEAYFLRAYNYFNLVRLFGHIPLVLTSIDASSPELYPDQAPVEKVYESIVSDLQEAEKANLPWTDESGRVTMAAVKSLLANVYLTMAGYPLQKGSEYYALAAEKAKEVINSGVCYLFEEYSDLRNPDMENKGEFIFMVQYQIGVVENPFQGLYLPYNLDISYYAAEAGSLYITEDFILSHEEGDKRAEEKQFYYSRFTSNTDRSQEVEFGYYLKSAIQ